MLNKRKPFDKQRQQLGDLPERKKTGWLRGILAVNKRTLPAGIGYNLHPNYWKGLMSEVLKEIIRFDFEDLGLHSVEANVNPNNQASIRLLGKSGFVREAYFRENFYFRGRFLDSAVYSLLAPQNR